MPQDQDQNSWSQDEDQDLIEVELLPLCLLFTSHLTCVTAEWAHARIHNVTTLSIAFPFTLYFTLLSVQYYAWTEYKFTCVCVCVSVTDTLSVNSPTGQTPQRIFTVDSLKDADLCKDVAFGVSMMNNHI